MKITSRISCALAAAVMLLFSSCINNDDTEQIQTETISSAVLYVCDASTGAMLKSQNVSAIIEINYTALTMGFTVSNLSLPDGTNLPSAKFSDLKLTQNNTGWILAEAIGIRPEVQGFSSETVPLFSKARIGAINHISSLDGQDIIGCERAISLETGNYIVYITTMQTWSTGYTKVSDGTGAEPYSSSKPIYLLSLDTTKQTAKIQVYNAVFAPAMENLGLVIEFRDLPYTIDAYGNIRIVHSDKFDPYHDNAPNSKFPISNLVCVWNLFSGLNISFECGAMGGSYSVSANMPFNYGINTDKQ